MERPELQDQLNQLQSRFEVLKSSLKQEEKQEQINELQKEMEAPDFWNDQKQAQITSQKASHLQQYLDGWKEIENQLTDLPQLLEIASPEELSGLNVEILKLITNFDQKELETLLNGEYDENSVILSIHTGNGGQDAEDFSQMLYRMYLRWAEDQDYKVQILEESTSDDGLKSATIEINGPMAYGYLKSEHGTHRLIRLSPFSAKSLRQTSFSRIEILPKIEGDNELKIEENDLRIDVFRSSGAGGQSVNTTDSAVRITYLPLNLIVTCQNEKSQHQNKAAAMNVLHSRLAQLKMEQQAAEIKELRGDLMENSFGSQIRTYTLHPYKMVKDHRTDHEENNPDQILDGNLEGFIQAFLRHQ